MNNRGFTLVELLTVVAIIGILSAMTLVTFPAARTRARDGVIMSCMGQLRAEAEVIYGENSNMYTTALGTSPAITTAWTSLIDDIESQVIGTATIISVDQAYCVAVTLNSNDVWCIDSTGFAGTPSANVCAGAVTHCE